MRRVEDVMGMPITVDVRSSRADDALLDAIFADLRVVDAVFSPYRAESAVSRMNAGTLAAADAGPLVAEILRLCDEYRERSHGYFDAWRGRTFDPSGLVKGWALARAAAALDAQGFRDYFVDGAGDVRTRGCSSDGEPWRVGIRHPVLRDKVVRVVLATDLAVATSGTYEKGTHIYDPHTGEAATALVSMTVLGPDILAADVFATASFAMGRAGLEFVEEQDGYEAYAIDRDLQGRWTSGFDRFCAP